jgi:hypothetical protein
VSPRLVHPSGPGAPDGDRGAPEGDARVRLRELLELRQVFGHAALLLAKQVQAAGDRADERRRLLHPVDPVGPHQSVLGLVEAALDERAAPVRDHREPAVIRLP